MKGLGKAGGILRRKRGKSSVEKAASRIAGGASGNAATPSDAAPGGRVDGVGPDQRELHKTGAPSASDSVDSHPAASNPAESNIADPNIADSNTVDSIASDVVPGPIQAGPGPATSIPSDSLANAPAPSSEAASSPAGPAPHKRVKIDPQRLQANGMVSSMNDHSEVAEEFRFIKRPLLLKAFATGDDAIANGNLIMVSSSKPGEGKTFCALSLAMSIALERDVTVLLIDADVAKPDIHNMLNFENDKGLVDLIADDNLGIPDVLVRTDLANLSIIPAGRQHHLAAELMASDRMNKIVKEISQRYSDRLIIFDSPPVLASSIPGILALSVGQILFVVEAERTNQHTVDSALALISGCKNLNLVLNKSRTLGARDKYGSYYYSN